MIDLAVINCFVVMISGRLAPLSNCVFQNLRVERDCFVIVKWLMVTISVIFPHRPSVSVFCQNARASEFETFGKPHYCSYLNLPWVLESFCCDD